MNSPRRKATHQQHSTSASAQPTTNTREPATTTATNTNAAANNHQQPTTNAQSQEEPQLQKQRQRQHATPSNNCSIELCPRKRSLATAARAAATKNNVTWQHGISVAASGESPPSGTEPQKSRASRRNCGGLSVTTTGDNDNNSQNSNNSGSLHP